MISGTISSRARISTSPQQTAVKVHDFEESFSAPWRPGRHSPALDTRKIPPGGWGWGLVRLKQDFRALIVSLSIICASFKWSSKQISGSLKHRQKGPSKKILKGQLEGEILFFLKQLRFF